MEPVSVSSTRERIISRNALLFLLSAITLSIFTISLVLASQDKVTVMTLIARGFIAIFGPFLSFLFFMSIVVYFYRSVLQHIHFKLMLQFTLVSALVAFIFAISLNTRSIFLALFATFLFNLPNQVTALLIFAILGPIIEETAKLLPVLFLSRGLITMKGKVKENRLLVDTQTTVFLGILSGYLFTLLETYWYTFNVSYLFVLDDPDIWQSLKEQVIIRFLNPLHPLATSIAAYGVAKVLFNTNQRIPEFREFKSGISVFFGAFAIHAVWNGSLVFVTDATTFYTLFGVGLPLFNWLMIFISLPLFGAFIFRVSMLEKVECETCGLIHSASLIDHTPIAYLRIGFWDQLKDKIPKYKEYRCQSCKNPIERGKEQCSRCNSRSMFGCPNCNAPLPVYSESCWRCDTLLHPTFDNAISFKKNNGDGIYTGILYILTVSYLGVILSVLVLLASGRYNTLDADFAGIQVVYLGIIGICLVLAIKWIHTPNRKALGISIARVITTILLMEFGFLLIGFAGLFIEIGYYIVTFLFLLEGIGFTIAGGSLLNFAPLFHSEDLL